MAALSSTIDSLVKEYLIFRGFTSSLKVLETEIKNDNNKSYKVDKILEQFSLYIQNYEIANLKSYWRYFERCYFCQLGHETYKLVKKLETNVLQLYVVRALQNNKPERVNEFFEKYALELQHDAAWSDWFILPFMKNPEQNKAFAMYFTKIWQDAVLLSLANCLDTIFSQITLPVLLNFEKEKNKLQLIQEENKGLQIQLLNYEKELNRLRSQTLLGKYCVATQTDDCDIESTQKAGESKTKSQAVKPRFVPWKFLGSKEKEKTKREANTSKQIEENSMRKPSLIKSEQVTVSNEDINFIDVFEKTNKQASQNADESVPIDTTERIHFYAEDNAPFIILSNNEFKEHDAIIVCCKFSSQSNSIASLDADGVLKVWTCYPNISSSSTISLDMEILSVDWLPFTENKLLLGRSDGQISVYDIGTKKFLWETTVSSQFKKIILLVCSPNSTTAACSSSNSQIKYPRKNSKLKKKKLYSDYDPSFSKEGCISVWDLQNGQLKRILTVDPFPFCIHSLTYNHNGMLLLTGGVDGVIRLFDIRNGDCLMNWHAHFTDIIDVIFNPSETCVYSLGIDGKLCIWDVNKVSTKISEYPLPAGSTGLHYYSEINEHDQLGQDEYFCGRLMCCHSEGHYIMICGPSGLMIYETNNDFFNESMHIVCPNSEVTTLDWSSLPNRSIAICGTKKGVVQISTLSKK
ncbi:WD repeat-containing protein 91 isoform X2 [Hydra vulgaris]|uniref:WD repeat-containing protein 91 n=1 Tax=Hydra vulgaris TaxID=6087 RepID=A0ABM4BIA2_HYDVU